MALRLLGFLELYLCPCRLSVDAQIWYQKLLEAEPCYFNTEVAPKALQVGFTGYVILQFTH